MPFDKISPQQLFIMRILTGLTFLALAGAIVVLAGGNLLDPTHATSRFTAPTDSMLYLVTVAFGALLANAGLMLLELVTKAPFKVAINVPFVAANFQTAVVFGLVAAGLWAKHATLGGESDLGTLQALTFAAFGMNLFFVVMTKMHWNFTENTGKALPKA
jgi:hypothetical protein